MSYLPGQKSHRKCKVFHYLCLFIAFFGLTEGNLCHNIPAKKLFFGYFLLPCSSFPISCRHRKTIPRRRQWQQRKEPQNSVPPRPSNRFVQTLLVNMNCCRNIRSCGNVSSAALMP